jgi:hypothetical protein
MQTNQSNNTNAHQGVQYGQNERVDDLNTRLGSRQFPDSPLQPNFDPRSVPTKYAQFPIINRRTPVSDNTQFYPEYNQTVNFNPCTDRAPIDGFKIEVENSLRNQHFALQHGADQSQYIPSTNSELYRNTVLSRPAVQPYPLLFANPQFSGQPNPNVENSLIGRDTFFNHTRTQLRNSM